MKPLRDQTEEELRELISRQFAMSPTKERARLIASAQMEIERKERFI